MSELQNDRTNDEEMEIQERFKCNVCKGINNMGEKEYNDHCDSLIHHINLEKSDKNLKHECRTCQVTCNNAVEYGLHMNTIAHKQSADKRKGNIDPLKKLVSKKAEDFLLKIEEKSLSKKNDASSRYAGDHNQWKYKNAFGSKTRNTKSYLNNRKQNKSHEKLPYPGKSRSRMKDSHNFDSPLFSPYFDSNWSKKNYQGLSENDKNFCMPFVPLDSLFSQETYSNQSDELAYGYNDFRDSNYFDRNNEIPQYSFLKNRNRCGEHRSNHRLRERYDNQMHGSSSYGDCSNRSSRYQYHSSIESTKASDRSSKFVNKTKKRERCHDSRLSPKKVKRVNKDADNSSKRSNEDESPKSTHTFKSKKKKKSKRVNVSICQSLETNLLKSNEICDKSFSKIQESAKQTSDKKLENDTIRPHEKSFLSSEYNSKSEYTMNFVPETNIEASDYVDKETSENVIPLSVPSSEAINKEYSSVLNRQCYVQIHKLQISEDKKLENDSTCEQVESEACGISKKLDSHDDMIKSSGQYETVLNSQNDGPLASESFEISDSEITKLVLSSDLNLPDDSGGNPKAISNDDGCFSDKIIDENQSDNFEALTKKKMATKVCKKLLKSNPKSLTSSLKTGDKATASKCKTLKNINLSSKNKKIGSIVNGKNISDLVNGRLSRQQEQALKSATKNFHRSFRKQRFENFPSSGLNFDNELTPVSSVDLYDLPSDLLTDIVGMVKQTEDASSNAGLSELITSIQVDGETDDIEVIDNLGQSESVQPTLVNVEPINKENQSDVQKDVSNDLLLESPDSPVRETLYENGNKETNSEINASSDKTSNIMPPSDSIDQDVERNKKYLFESHVQPLMELASKEQLLNTSLQNLRNEMTLLHRRMNELHVQEVQMLQHARTIQTNRCQHLFALGQAIGRSSMSTLNQELISEHRNHIFASNSGTLNSSSFGDSYTAINANNNNFLSPDSVQQASDRDNFRSPVTANFNQHSYTQTSQNENNDRPILSNGYSESSTNWNSLISSQIQNANTNSENSERQKTPYVETTLNHSNILRSRSASTSSNENVATESTHLAGNMNQELTKDSNERCLPNILQVKIEPENSDSVMDIINQLPHPTQPSQSQMNFQYLGVVNSSNLSSLPDDLKQLLNNTTQNSK